MAERQKVLGIGGFFFRSKNPQKLAQWYQDTFGIITVGESYDDPCWVQEEGTTVFAPFNEGTSYFGRPEQQWMINFRVADLKAMTAQLDAAGISVEVDPEVYPNGLFARCQDPEGNPVQLWQETEMTEVSEGPTP
jgi:predicted enzyme related to lactoylglutathione lyase